MAVVLSVIYMIILFWVFLYVDIMLITISWYWIIIYVLVGHALITLFAILYFEVATPSKTRSVIAGFVAGSFICMSLLVGLMGLDSMRKNNQIQ